MIEMKNTNSQQNLNQYHIGVHVLFRLFMSCAAIISLPSAPSAPLNLTFSAGGVLNGSITLTWTPPEDPNGIVQFYQMQQSSPSGVMYMNTTDNSTTIVLSNLVPGTQYNFSVKAVTVAFGPLGDKLSVHTADGEGIGCHTCDMREYLLV